MVTTEHTKCMYSEKPGFWSRLHYSGSFVDRESEFCFGMENGGGENAHKTRILDKVGEVSSAIDAAKQVDEVICALSSLAVLLFPLDASALSGSITFLLCSYCNFASTKIGECYLMPKNPTLLAWKISHVDLWIFCRCWSILQKQGTILQQFPLILSLPLYRLVRLFVSRKLLTYMQIWEDIAFIS